MSTEALQRNKTYFEQIVSGTPDPFKPLSQAVLWPFNELLELVAGEPDDLMRAAQLALSTGEAVRQLAGDQIADRARLRGAWDGDAAEKFHASMESVEEAIEELAKGLDGTKEVLVDAANAAVDAFNLLVELILEFLLWFLTEVIIAAVAAFLSAGISLAATVVRVLARLATTVGRMVKIVARFAEILTKLVTKLEKVAQLLTKYRKTVMELRKAKKAYRAWNKSGYTREALQFKLKRTALLFPGKYAINKVSPVNVPGIGGALLDTGVGMYDVSDGHKDRNYLVDGTYQEDLGPYTRGVQNVFDSIVN
ncbi:MULTISPECIES: WXG100 family type VII secretion target [Micromonospora]|uniref:WXG100 family type VII secretion target n=1 Tax=Micromonospora solifontis TaxID=2487138 RepID=A0ABX9WMU9_9ACTN|nr:MULTISPECIES: WXG100 family type VII secretion target [Micromonospora]NES13338.1 WXG100 family type VII secretion target [Micromonospora sp. PPF5-17B]NES34707.1 WXG100 family type VII secretion target [Micromonospora solifontis]NES57223.1 WXG100 family type VII secretion target [Micromonospora sp. PPF5-6]RNM01945.1 WXG100 family type VII secretion target [Micromonospora solifontis]